MAVIDKVFEEEPSCREDAGRIGAVIGCDSRVGTSLNSVVAWSFRPDRDGAQSGVIASSIHDNANGRGRCWVILGRREDEKKVEACSIIKTGERMPLALVASVLQRSGVRLGRIDDDRHMIHGRVGSWPDRHACKVMVRIYPRREMTLVEMTCRGSRKRPGYEFLCSYLDALKRNLEDSMPVDANGSIDWETEQFGAKRNSMTGTDAVELLRKMEVGSQ